MGQRAVPASTCWPKPLNVATGSWRSPAAHILLGDGSGLAAVVHGDGRDREAVRRAVVGADAVLSTVPGGSRREPHRAVEVTQTIIQAMEDLGVLRLVVTSAYPLVADEPVALLRLLFARPYADATAMEQAVGASDLDWTTSPGELADPTPSKWSSGIGSSNPNL